MALHTTLYTWAQRNPGKIDAIVVGLLIVLFGVGSSGTTAANLALSIALLLPLAWRRTHTEIAGAALVVVCLVQFAFAWPPSPTQWAVLVMIYSLAAFAKRWASFTGLGLGVLGALMFSLRNVGSEVPYQEGAEAAVGQSTGSDLSLGVFFFSSVLISLAVLTSWLLGDLTRTRRLSVQQIQERARRLEVEQMQERELAAADERARIAREMHDIVAHSLTVIITQADGARYAAQQDPTIATATLETIASTGRSSLKEMRRLLGVLRADEVAEIRPQPALVDVPDLIELMRHAGLAVTVDTRGDAKRQLPQGAELVAYRVIQESLTNTMKHAGADVQAQVLVEWAPRALEITVTDNGRGLAADPSTAGSLQGIVGMRERVALYDGEVHAHGNPGGGFKVSAFIPYSEN